LCRNRECLRSARKRDALSKALKTKVPLEIYEELEKLCLDDETAGRAKKSEEEKP
jgi:predicted RNA-binding protein YlxR (DUF448 family)